MNRLQTIAVTLVATALTATAAPRVALVRVNDIYSSLQSTATLQQEIKRERDQIMQHPSAVELRKTIDDLQILQTKLSGKDDPVDDEAGRNLARSYEIKRQEAQTLQKEFESFRAGQEQQINRKLVAGMRASLNRIMEYSSKVAKEQGYDMVFDGSGNTNTGIAFVIYQKNSPDLTEDVKTVLMNSAPASPAETASKPADAPTKPPKH